MNNIFVSLHAPTWAQTNRAEVRKLRMHMVVLYPQLMCGKHTGNDATKSILLERDMSPLEGAYLAATLLYQKEYNSDYQFTAQEKADNAKSDASEIEEAHEARTAALHAAIANQFVLLPTAIDRLFGDLGIPNVTASAVSVKNDLAEVGQ